MARKTPQQVAKKWADKLTNSTQQIREGVTATTVNPMAEAAKHLQRAKQRYVEMIDSGQLEARLLATPQASWKDGMLTRGINRIPEGAQAGISKTERFLTGFLPAMYAASDQVKDMPKNTLTQALEKVRIVAEAAKKARGKTV